MNIFILCTGRCGSIAFIKACAHITNFTSAHESRSAMLGEDRFDYPRNHIEADNRLSWLLGRLSKKYGDDAVYVHLKRKIRDTALSFSRRYDGGIIRAYRGDGILLGLSEEIDPICVSSDYCHTVNSNIELFLKDKTRKIEVSLENIDRDFTTFWELVGAEGQINAALAEFNTRHNASKRHQNLKKAGMAPRIFDKLKRLLVNLPGFIKES